MFFKMLGERITGFIAKMFALKTVVFIVATLLFIHIDKFPWYGWLIAATMFLGLRYMEKLKGLGGFK